VVVRPPRRVPVTRPRSAPGDDPRSRYRDRTRSRLLALADCVSYSSGSSGWIKTVARTQVRAASRHSHQGAPTFAGERLPAKSEIFGAGGARPFPLGAARRARCL